MDRRPTPPSPPHRLESRSFLASVIVLFALAGWHPLTVEFYDHGGGAFLKLLTGTSKKTVRPVAPAALCCKAPEQTPRPAGDPGGGP